jgi:hypothetical protein
MMEERGSDLFDDVRIGTAKHQGIDGRKGGQSHDRRAHEPTYFSPVRTLEKSVFSVDPMLLTTATITSAMPPAMMEYSIAVAPDSSSRNHHTRLRMVCSLESLLPPHRELCVCRLGNP